MASFESTSGLAGEIRAATASEQFDLGGYTEQRTKDLITTAFGTELVAPTEMVRFTFVVGGGKLVRSRYADDIPKWMTGALRDVGYTEDRSAACTFDSQGTYKQQHDTGQNLKTIIVFPKVSCSKNSVSQENSDANDPAMDTKSPHYIVVACQLNTFQDIVNSKITTWRQKKNLLKIIQESADKFKELEAKLIRGELLSPNEQAIYDMNGGQDTEKLAWLQGEIKSMVDNGQLSISEKEDLIASLNANVTSLNEEIETTKAENKPKKVEKLEEKKKAIQARLTTINNITPIIHQLKHADEVIKLRVKLLTLLTLEDKGRSMSLTIADLKTLEEKSEIEEGISSYETASRGWFENDADFELKCKAVEKAAKVKYAAKLKAAEKKKPAPKGNTNGNSSQLRSGTTSGAWSTMPTKKKTGSASNTTKSSNSGSGFSRAFGNDSDSDG